MFRVAWLTIAALVAAAPASAAAGAGGFTLVNATGAGLKSVAIRRFGTQDWRPLTAAPGARSAVDFADPDCAFDIRATLDGGATAQWSGVNLCEVKAVILSRNATGATWVDYD